MDFAQIVQFDWTALTYGPQPPVILVAAAVSAITTVALIIGLSPRAGGASGTRRAPEPEPGRRHDCDFLIDGCFVKPMTETASNLLDKVDNASNRLSALGSHLASEHAGIQKDLEDLALYGTPFRHQTRSSDGSIVDLVGEPRGNSAFFTIRPASEEAHALQQAHKALDGTGRELAFLRSVIDRAPVLAWSKTPDGQIGWANAPYLDRFDSKPAASEGQRITDVFGHVLDEVPLTARGEGSRRRVSVASSADAEARWYEISQWTGDDGGTAGYALEADELVHAEASLHRFVETLTETFAHLPIGLAVFDKNRRLGLFNPALSELVRIDAVWLAGRPSLRDFLERLRETRQMPEQKDFATWRRKLSELEQGARDGTYEENWVLPSGKIFRVTGRPHPKGALAFLFEDISSSIMLERQYRSELELSQATLDRLSEAVAVFDTSGAVVFVNSAFEKLWKIDPMDGLVGPGIKEMAATWSELCQPSPFWAKLCEFATAEDERASWSGSVETRDGRDIQIIVAPLPDASALVVFRDLSLEASDRAEIALARDGRARDAVLDELAIEQIHEPVEKAVQQVMAAIPSVHNPDAFQSLNSAAQELRESLQNSRELHALARSAANPDGPLPALKSALASRGLSLEVPPDAATWRPELRRSALAIGFAAADLASSAGTVKISVESGEGRDRLQVSTSTRIDGPPDSGTALALARRTVDAEGAALTVRVSEGIACLSTELLHAGRRPRRGSELKAISA